MKQVLVQELSNYIGISRDTIRHYRDIGLLEPKRLENGYYIYTPREALEILYMRELRGQRLSLPSIEETFNHSSIFSFQNVLEQNKKRIYQEIEMKKLELLRLLETKKYIDKGIDLLKNKSIDVYQGEKTATLCSFNNAEFNGNSLNRWTEHFPFSYVVITISSKELERKTNEPYKVNVGCGILRKYFDKFKLEDNKNISIYPSGKYARICVAIKDPFQIYPHHVQALLDYSEDNGITLKHGIGARLVFIEHHNTNPLYYFMFWANVD